MRLFWKKEKPVSSPHSVEEVATNAARSAVSELKGEVDASVNVILERLNAMNASPFPLPPPNAKSPYPVYALNAPWQFYTPQAPTRPPQSLLSINDLRLFADRYDILRDCIQQLKREVAATPLEITGKEARRTSQAQQKRIEEAESFFSTRGGLGGFCSRRSDFEGKLIEDVCIIGAGAIYFHPTRGGGVYTALPIDAGTIRPRVDAFGWAGPGEEVFEQWVNGLYIRGFTYEELSYLGLGENARSWSPYYASPVEWLMSVIMTGMKSDEWNRAWLTDGNTPSDMLALPDEWTPEQIKDYATWFDDLLAGNAKGRQKTKFVPGGSQKVGNLGRKDQDFTELELQIMRRTCAMFGVQPASIGFVGEQYKVTQEASMGATSAFGVGTLLTYRKDMYDDLLERMGYSDLEVKNVSSVEEDKLESAQRYQLALNNKAWMTQNEVRLEEGLDPVEDGYELNPVEPMPDASSAASSDGKNSKNKEFKSATEKADSGDTKRALMLWQKKSLSRMKQRGKPVCDFEDVSLSPLTRTAIRSALGNCANESQVKELFTEFVSAI